jgi:hypothetical protein
MPPLRMPDVSERASFAHQCQFPFALKIINQVTEVTTLIAIDRMLYATFCNSSSLSEGIWSALANYQ